MDLFLDIETIPTSDPAVIAEIAAKIKPPGNMKKAETIAQWETDEKPALVEEAVAKTAFDGAYGRICSIAYAFGDGETISNCSTDERRLIAGFYEDLATIKGAIRVIGHSVSGFDLKFLWKRSVVLGVKPAALPFNAKPWESGAVYDTMVQWDADRDKRISLDSLCKVLGIPSPKGELDGSKIAQAFADGRYDDIAAYNRKDVEAVRAVYRKMTFQAAS